MTLRRYAPIVQSRGTQIPARLRVDVFERDGGCVGVVVEMPGDCFGGLELDHVRASHGVGLKSSTEAANLVALCSNHHRVKTEAGRQWRPVLLDYIATRENPHAHHVDPCGPTCHPDRILRRSDASIAKHLGRSVVGIRLKTKRLGMRKRDAGMTGRDVAAIFGIDGGTIGKVWIRRGLLWAVQAPYRQGPHPVWIIDEAEVERFIRAHPEYVDVAKMPDSPYRDLAARDPWIGTPEVHRLTGRNHHAITRLVLDGSIRGRRRGAHWYIPLADVPKIRHLAPDHIEDSRFRRASLLEIRRNRRRDAATPEGQPV